MNRTPIPATGAINSELCSGVADRFDSVLSCTDGRAVSPSFLRPTGEAASYEFKFLIAEPQAQAIERWAQQHLSLDGHADSSLGNAYRITSLYLDTARLDVYHRSGAFKRRKFRIRRYGAEPGVFLEREAKSGDRVSKRRTHIPELEIARLQDALADPVWPAHWFHSRIVARGLQPSCQVTYDRVAHVGMNGPDPMRLTLDRRIHSAPATTWVPGEVRTGIPLLTGKVILELKFRTSMPLLFKSLVHEYALNPGSASKYRLSIESWGLAGCAKEVG